MGKFMLLLMSMVLLCIVFVASEALIQKIDKTVSTKNSGANSAQASGVVGQLPAINKIDATVASAGTTTDSTAYAKGQVLPPAYVNDVSKPAPVVFATYAESVLNEETRMAEQLLFRKEPNFGLSTLTLLPDTAAPGVAFHLLI